MVAIQGTFPRSPAQTSASVVALHMRVVKSSLVNLSFVFARACVPTSALAGPDLWPPLLGRDGGCVRVGCAGLGTEVKWNSSPYVRT